MNSSVICSDDKPKETNEFLRNDKIFNKNKNQKNFF